MKNPSGYLLHPVNRYPKMDLPRRPSLSKGRGGTAEKRSSLSLFMIQTQEPEIELEDPRFSGSKARYGLGSTNIGLPTKNSMPRSMQNDSYKVFHETMPPEEEYVHRLQEDVYKMDLKVKQKEDSNDSIPTDIMLLLSNIGTKATHQRMSGSSEELGFKKIQSVCSPEFCPMKTVINDDPMAIYNDLSVHQHMIWPPERIYSSASMSNDHPNALSHIHSPQPVKFVKNVGILEDFNQDHDQTCEAERTRYRQYPSVADIAKAEKYNFIKNLNHSGRKHDTSIDGSTREIDNRHGTHKSRSTRLFGRRNGKYEP